MLWGKKSAKEEEKLSRPKEIPVLVQDYLAVERKMDPDFVKLLKAVMSKGQNGGKVFNIRIFDESDALARKVQVTNYLSLDDRQDLIIYEGWFDDAAKQVKLEEKRKASSDTPILTEDEIRQKIEALGEPGSTVFFYLGRGCSHGGPLGMGAAIIELNPAYPGKKQKKYNIYVTDVIDMVPGDRGEKLFDSDKLKSVTSWVKGNHHKRVY